MSTYETKDWACAHEIRPADIYNRYLPYKTDGFFIEIGMGGTLPPSASNTGDFADIGWSGAFFEPMQRYCEEAEIRHKDNLDRIKIFNCAVGDEEGELQLFPGDTLIKELHIHYDKIGWLPEKYKETYGEHFTKVITPTQALQMAKCPARYDVLSVDVEGFELKIIENYDFNRWRPILAVIELRTDNASFTPEQKVDSDRVIEIMIDNDYQIVHRDPANFWFLDNLYLQHGEE